MARKPPSPAQRANEITFLLKGDLKNKQLSFLRVGRRLAQIRDGRFFAALKFASMEDYAAKRLKLGRASMYRYLQVHDWVREFHPRWLANKPKGFIPELSDVLALMSIDRWLTEPGLDAKRRKALESAQRKALAGELSKREFEALVPRRPAREDSLRAIMASLRTVAKRARRLPGIAEDLVRGLDELVARFGAAVSASREVARLVSATRVQLAKADRRKAKTPIA
ncbi:MAG: hypothetical protein ACREQJ_16700 [Candidatus Binatia bacterium]